MRVASKIISLVLVLNFIYFVNPASAASSGPSSPPANFETFKAKINESLIGYRCGSSDSIGFSGNWLITEDDKNSGVNSMVFTPGGSLWNCGRYETKFSFEYKAKTYQGTVWNSGEKLPDFGSFRSSAIIPDLPLWGTTAPSEGSWVAVVNYLSGFGFSWKESKVIAYNPDTLIFAVNPTVPLIEKNALVFNNKGDFLGVVSKYGIKSIENGVLVHGAPLQCNLNASQGASTVTICPEGVYAQNIWKNSATTPASTPNSKQVCVLATGAAGFTAEECSDLTTWTFGFCDTMPMADLQILRNKKWVKVKTSKGEINKEKCPDSEESSNWFNYRFTGNPGSKYRIKNYGDKRYATGYINLKITVKDGV
jgi:hypothetical protein